VLACAAIPAQAAPAHGQLLHLAPSLRVNSTTSSDWSGYSQGTLEQGGKLFNAISGSWTVPTATQHTLLTSANSSDWIGIGGGCLDATCSSSDSTLIQTGTEQDVDVTGAASYSAWWEIVPLPSTSISMTVAPGDRIQASIAEVIANSDVWDITLTDVTRNETFTTTVPYTSTHATAEWIQETPVSLGASLGISALPNLTNPAFDLATTNGAPANLSPSEEVDLIDSNSKVVAAPSAPDRDLDGFSVCAWAASCAAPASS
jgi:hypothetical protein